MLTEVFGYCVRVTDLERAMHFYGDILGLPVLATVDRPRYRIVIYSVGASGEEVLNLFYYKNPEDVDDVYPHCAFKVEDQARMRGRLTDHGVPMLEVMGNIFIKDPDGNNIEISKIKPGEKYGP